MRSGCAALSFCQAERAELVTPTAVTYLDGAGLRAIPRSPVRAREPRLRGGLLGGASVVLAGVRSPAALRGLAGLRFERGWRVPETSPK
jgi:hypothetical protein